MVLKNSVTNNLNPSQLFGEEQLEFGGLEEFGEKFGLGQWSLESALNSVWFNLAGWN